MSVPRVLVAGIGNIFLGDDAFGCEVAQRLAGRDWPEGVRVADFGIRGLDLAYALLDGPEATVFVDAVPRGGEPGTVYVIELDLTQIGAADQGKTVVDAHTMNPLAVLAMVQSLGGALRQITLVGCEPGDLGTAEEGKMGLSPPVAAAVDNAIECVERLVSDILARRHEAVELR